MPKFTHPEWLLEDLIGGQVAAQVGTSGCFLNNNSLVAGIFRVCRRATRRLKAACSASMEELGCSTTATPPMTVMTMIKIIDLQGALMALLNLGSK